MPQYISSYVHGDGKVGVLLQLKCRDSFAIRTDELKELAHNLALQIAATTPLSVSPEDLSSAHWEAELHFLKEKLRDLDTLGRQKRLKQMRDRFERDHCLVKQTYIKDDTLTVEALISVVSAKLRDQITIVKFVRYDATEI